MQNIAKRNKWLMSMAVLIALTSSASAVNTDYGIRVNDSLPTKSQVSDVTVGYINYDQAMVLISGGSRWAYVFETAIDELNEELEDAKSCVRFRFTGRYDADVSLQFATLNRGVPASSAIGDNLHGIGYYLKLSDRVEMQNLDFDKKIAIAKHELLHTIGFRHSRTNREAKPCTKSNYNNCGSVEVPNTDSFWEWNYYGHSIMEEKYHDGVTNLSELDKRALRYIFPE